MGAVTTMSPRGCRELAAYVRTVRLRSGGVEWHATGIEDVLNRHRDMADEVDLAIAALRAAQNPVNRTPGVIVLEGPHWRGLGEVEGVRFEPTPSALLCSRCSRRREVCEADPFSEHEYVAVKDHAQGAGGGARERARRALEEGRLKLCPHGQGLLCEVCYPSRSRQGHVSGEEDRGDGPGERE